MQASALPRVRPRSTTSSRAATRLSSRPARASRHLPALDRRRGGTSRRVEEEVEAVRHRHSQQSLRSPPDRAGVRQPRPVAGRHRRRVGMAELSMGRRTARRGHRLRGLAVGVDVGEGHDLNIGSVKHHRGTEAARSNGAPCRVDRLEHPAGPRSAIWKILYRAERPCSRRRR